MLPLYIISRHWDGACSLNTASWKTRTMDVSLEPGSCIHIHKGMDQNYTHSFLWDEISHPYPNFNGGLGNG